MATRVIFTVPATCTYYSGMRRTVVDALIVEKIICRHVNSERRRCGHDHLRLSQACASKARAHAEEMRRRNYFAHISPGGKDWNAGGRTPECIAMLQGMGGRSDAAIALAVVRTWKGSAPHYAAILNASGFLGAGVAMGVSGRIYAVLQMTWNPEDIKYRKRPVSGTDRGRHGGGSGRPKAGRAVSASGRPSRRRGKGPLLRRIVGALFRRV